MTQQSLYRIVLIDDSRMMRLGLRDQLGGMSDFRVVGEAVSAAEGIELVTQLKPDVVLLDMSLPDMSGVQTCRQMLARSPLTRVIMLSMYDDPSIIREAITAGARGYVLKDAPIDLWLDAIRRVASGDSYIQPQLIALVLREVHAMANGLSSKGLADLSPQEQRLLPLLAQGKTNKEIASALALSDKTVKNYLSNIFSKLGITRRTQAATLYARTLPNRTLRVGEYV